MTSVGMPQELFIAPTICPVTPITGGQLVTDVIVRRAVIGAKIIGINLHSNAGDYAKWLIGDSTVGDLVKGVRVGIVEPSAQPVPRVFLS
jgi:hypothetical protein